MRSYIFTDAEKDILKKWLLGVELSKVEAGLLSKTIGRSAEAQDRIHKDYLLMVKSLTKKRTDVLAKYASERAGSKVTVDEIIVQKEKIVVDVVDYEKCPKCGGQLLAEWVLEDLEPEDDPFLLGKYTFRHFKCQSCDHLEPAKEGQSISFQGAVRG